MRMLAFAFALPLLVVAALVLPVAAGAQNVKQVEVTNPSVRFQLVGFTEMAYDANMGGWFGTTEKCQMDFAGARICTFDEVRNTTTIPVLPGGTEAWAEDGNKWCTSWTRTHPGTTASARVVSSDTGVKLGPGALCTTFNPIACCALVP